MTISSPTPLIAASLVADDIDEIVGSSSFMVRVVPLSFPLVELPALSVITARKVITSLVP